MSLELETHATLNSLNLRKEGPDSNKVLAVDMKLDMQVDPGILACFNPTLRDFLFNGAGNPRFPNMEPVTWKGEMLNMELRIDRSLKFRDVTLKKFSLQPMLDKNGDQCIALAFQASFKPAGTEAAALSECLQESIQLEIEPQPSLI
ncbi:hypothetical protein [Chitinimonas lacunae]|uniref:Uncharacterized protein n=1 Tax=Chitinimonas lacunae TaxID=1963018 RepID=A0ABV8MN11_9NEIS